VLIVELPEKVALETTGYMVASSVVRIQRLSGHSKVSPETVCGGGLFFFQKFHNTPRTPFQTYQELRLNPRDSTNLTTTPPQPDQLRTAAGFATTLDRQGTGKGREAGVQPA
jgi:hypothetical protein